MSISIRPKRRLWHRIRKNAMLYLLLLLPVTYIIVFKYVPMYGAQIAFRDYSVSKGIWESPWVGLKHFERFINNRMFIRVLTNTLRISLYSLMTFPCSIIFAFMLHYLPFRRMKKTVQMISYAPHFISTVVICAMINSFFSSYGMVNQLRGLLGLDTVNFLGDPKLFTPLYVWTGVWQGVGYGSIIYISSLVSVDQELHEAAIIDGADLLKRVWHIDIPSILPMVTIMLIMRCGNIVSVGYEKVYLLQNTLNKTTSEVISTYVYNIGVNASMPQYSYSSAIGMFTSIINMVMLVVVNFISKKVSNNSIW